MAGERRLEAAVRHILVTNDDGIDSPGLHALAQSLQAVGEVTVIAPDSNRSAIGRGITIHHPLHLEERPIPGGIRAFATDGTPVDCVRFAVSGILERPPDLVVSGINLGSNLGDDVTYSGTVAAALEGMLLGLPAIALSAQATDASADVWDGSAYDFRVAAAFAARLVPVVADPDYPPRVILNVNVPGRPPERVSEAWVTRLGRRIYSDQLVRLEDADGRRRYSIYGPVAGYQREQGTDFAAIEAGAVSVTPMHFDLTDLDGMDRLEALALADLLAPDARMYTS